MLSTSIATDAPRATPEEAVEWLNAQNLGHSYRGRRYSYRFAIVGNILEIQERHYQRVFRQATVALDRLREITISDVGSDEVNVSSVTLEGGTRSISHFLDGRRKAERSILIWIEHDRNLARRLARALAHLGDGVFISESHASPGGGLALPPSRDIQVA